MYPLFSAPSLSLVTTVWLGVRKNQRAVISVDNHSDAEKYLEYVDGTSYEAFGDVIYNMPNYDGHLCIRSENQDGSKWVDTGCSPDFGVLCEFNCDNVN